jgi:DNA-directed RNA polymerase specialized sigma24 family protein
MQNSLLLEMLPSIRNGARAGIVAGKRSYGDVDDVVQDCVYWMLKSKQNVEISSCKSYAYRSGYLSALREIERTDPIYSNQKTEYTTHLDYRQSIPDNELETLESLIALCETTAMDVPEGSQGCRSDIQVKRKEWFSLLGLAMYKGHSMEEASKLIGIHINTCRLYRIELRKALRKALNDD